MSHLSSLTIRVRRADKKTDTTDIGSALHLKADTLHDFQSNVCRFWWLSLLKTEQRC